LTRRLEDLVKKFLRRNSEMCFTMQKTNHKVWRPANCCLLTTPKTA